ncbi:MAG: nucleoside hydrolase [Caldilineaceae bacterium SB0664_bin_22]|nr:nucleoside hydrolase [Caldilineaceae bacterium SB0664_bin_22]
MAEIRSSEPPPPAGRVRMVLDTDTYNEIDDQFALVHVMLSPTEVDLQAVYAAPFLNNRSSSAGDGMEKSYEEILRLFGLLGQEPEGMVFRGSDRFMDSPRDIVQSPAVEHMLSLLAEGDEPLYVVAIGAPTNVSSVLLAARERNIDLGRRMRVVWLGGQPLHRTNAREFNLMQDPIASRLLFQLSPSLILFPCWGVASHLLTTVPELERHLAPLGPVGAFLTDRFAAYSDDHYAWAKEVWDLAATAYVINPDWTRSRLATTPDLDIATLDWVPQSEGPPMREATMVDRNAIFRDLFQKVADFHG